MSKLTKIKHIVKQHHNKMNNTTIKETLLRIMNTKNITLSVDDIDNLYWGIDKVDVQDAFNELEAEYKVVLVSGRYSLLDPLDGISDRGRD